MANENLKLPPEIEQLTQKLVADPKSRVFAQLADAYRKAGMTDEAIETAKKGMENHPNYPAAHLILGRCYLEKQMYALAREEFEAAIKSDPQNLVAYKLLAGTYEKQNMFAEAVKFYQMVLDLEPGDADLTEKVASLKARQEEKPQPAPEPAPAPAPVPEASPVMEAVRAEAEPEPAREEQAAAPAEERPEAKPGEPAKEEAVVFPEPIPFPDVLAEETEPVKPEGAETKPVLESPAPENKTEEEKPAIKEEEVIAIPGSVPPMTAEEPVPAGIKEEAVITETKEEPAKAGEPEVTAEGKPAAATVTLAEIYVQQGFYEKAVEVYRELIAAEPENEDYKVRMDELLEKAFPEEKTAETAVEEKGPEAAAMKGEAVPEPAAAEPETSKEPVPETPASSAAEAAPLADIFGGMFGKLEKPEPEAEGPRTEEPKAAQPEEVLAKAFTPEEHSKPVFEPLAEKADTPSSPEPQPVPEPAKEAAVDFSALFSDAPKAQTEQPAAAEPAKPEPETGKKAEGENTVSSFQSWLSSLQK